VSGFEVIEGAEAEEVRNSHRDTMRGALQAGKVIFTKSSPQSWYGHFPSSGPVRLRARAATRDGVKGFYLWTEPR